MAVTILKIGKITISQKPLLILMKFGTMRHIVFRTLIGKNVSKFKNWRWWTATIWKWKIAINPSKFHEK